MNVDLKKITTEGRNSNTTNIDVQSTIDILKLINNEDKTVPYAVEKALTQIVPLVDRIVEAFQQGGRLIYMGAGTSGRIGIIDAVECRPTFSAPDDMVMCLMAGGEKALIKAVEGAEDSIESAVHDLKQINVSNKDVVIGITASGRTPYAVSGVKYAKSIGVATGCITTSEHSEIASCVDYPIEAITGPEPLTGSTRMKSGTAQKLICNLISTTSMIKMGKVYQNLMIDVQPTNQKLVVRAQNIVMEITGVSREDARLAIEKFGSVKKAIFSIMTDIDSTDQVNYYMNQANGHIRNAIKLVNK
ncbi:MAG TPA: N-acetylmuramic acid 6-phosphate etherase [Bacilli bacterium]|nr:N-acetylmuramic acid 6-phosphate etherase [Bacilli bacterium]